MGAGDFREDEARTPAVPEQLVLDLDGFEGPIDMLLALAREQKVDLTTISILALADQYLAFVAEARRVRLELAADYLVMAAWLAYLKSRLLLPEPDQEEPPAEEMAAALAFQLQRLEAMKDAAARLMARPRLGIDIFARGAPEEVDIARTAVYRVSLYDLLSAYGRHKRRKDTAVLHVEPMRLYSIEDAVHRLEELLGRMPDWTMLQTFLPAGVRDPLLDRSALAAHFAAALELVKAGQADLHQDGAFGPIWVRRRAPGEEEQ
ncbi:segregation and condensation protein A [Azospirillum halopraeferens]|uniref:segregation and condensation protein A n=1 Tax=Azospirillum halopraeferens TaxID=34010 RepID=UPI0004257723|nr:ScpA family protein [Azospirillum halopraeferens]